MVNSQQLQQLHIGPEWVDALNRHPHRQLDLWKE